MVWLVSEQVNGESVLVPVVYLSQKTAESVASGAVIEGTTVNLNASRQLTSTGTIQASQDASIKAGHLLNAGNLSAGGSLSVQAAQDLLNAGTIQGGNVTLVAGNDLVSGTNAGGIHLGEVKLDSLNVPNLNLPATGSITAIGDLTAQAGHNLTLDHATLSAGNHLGLAAANDLTATASTLNAGGSAHLIAGNNLGLNASAGQRSGEQTDHSATATMHADVTTLKAGGNVVLAAGNDLTSQGAQLQASDQLALSAGHDISLNAVTDTQSQGNSWRNGSTQYSQYAYDEHLRGTVIDGANGVALSAGHDVTTVAANVTSANGGIVIAAGNDIHLHAGQENHTWQQDSTSKTSGFLSSTTKTTHDATQDSLAVGTLLSGSAVTVAAGRDITAQAAQIVATDDVVMAAGNNLELGTATSTHGEQHDRTTKNSGMFTSGLNLMIGSSKESQSYSETDTTPQGSVIGSLNGGVTLTAGNLVTSAAVTCSARPELPSWARMSPSMRPSVRRTLRRRISNSKRASHLAWVVVWQVLRKVSTVARKHPITPRTTALKLYMQLRRRIPAMRRTTPIKTQQVRRHRKELASVRASVCVSGSVPAVPVAVPQHTMRPLMAAASTAKATSPLRRRVAT
jgi:filamentous hemagglutinin